MLFLLYYLLFITRLFDFVLLRVKTINFVLASKKLSSVGKSNVLSKTKHIQIYEVP